MNNAKKILIMGANPETVSLITKAKQMGFITYVTDYNPFAYAKKFADVPVNIDASNVDELVEYVLLEHIDCVLVGVAEALLPYYYQVCERLNYPCFASLEQFELMISKDKFKEVCRKYQVPVVDEYDCNVLNEVCYPSIVKPIDSCSSKGISICNDRKELDIALKKALECSKRKKVLIEKYMTGEEVVIYYVIQDSIPFLVGMCDRYTNKEQKGVAQLPTSYIFPSKYLNLIKDIDENICEMLQGIGIKNGVLFLQAFVDDGKIKIYEPGFRLNGAQEHIILSELTGIDAKELLLNYSIRGKLASYSIRRKAAPDLHGAVACKLSPLVKTGKIAVLKGLDEIAEMDGVISVNPSYYEGDIVDGIGTLKQIICRFFIVADNKKDLADIIESIYSKLIVLDDNNNSMLLTKFDTSILMEE